ncbi:outer dynein arm-docking complex subunit 3 [Diachasmimorpha longicaudata]|uniref:outer dynein arm-docking complex subunit 3 n=1 Tax=Diachasmimorpha longicaudata TaxID=58733 RepID=UPI0030B8FDE3
MADPLVSSIQENKLTTLNRKIIEIKKKIQLSEGQRKANFEECDAKKRESLDILGNLKKEIKTLQIKYTKAKNNEEAADKVALTSRESSVCVRKCGLEQAIARVDEDNIRLRKKLDLVKYESDKQQDRLSKLLGEYEQYINGKVQKFVERKLDNPLKKKVISLENHLHRISVMQMEADTVRKKYRSVRASLKSDAAFYVSQLKNLEKSIKDQDAEINQLQGVKTEAVDLRDITKETLTKQEIEAMHTSKERENVILDYRQRVEDRRLELERLERMIFPAVRLPPREDDFEGPEKTEGLRQEIPDKPKDEITFLEEAFAKLRSATGVTRNADVLDRFLAQRATKENLQRMRTVTEDEKMGLEKQRQKFTAEIEMQKFSETKDADQNAEELARLNDRIEGEKQRQNVAEVEEKRVQGTLHDVAKILWKFCDRLRDVNDSFLPMTPENLEDPYCYLLLLEEKMESLIDMMGGHAQYDQWIQEAFVDKFETLSTGSASEAIKAVDAEARPLFPRFPGAPTPAAQPIPSEDEEEIPTRSVLKRQAQLLVDTKSRRKGFNFRR